MHCRGLARALRCPLVDKDDARDCFQVNVADLQAGGHANKSLQAQASTPPPGATVDWNALSYDIMFQGVGVHEGQAPAIEKWSVL